MNHRIVAKFMFLLALGSSTASFANPAELRGGSDYAFFGLEGCKRSDATVLPAYNQKKDVIDQQLAAMYASGQRRLRIPIFYRHSNKSPGLMDASTGDLAAQDKENLGAFLAAVKKAGFEQVEVGFFPISESSPAAWKDWDEAMYQQNWSLIQHLRPVLVASGVPYLIDLDNEATPAANQKVLLQYAKRLWSDYTKAYGSKDTVGFSIIPNEQQDRFAQMPQIYGSNPPAAFDLHLYGDAYAKAVNAHKRLNALGYGNVPWIIGESYYNDAQEAAEITKAVNETHQKVLFLLQWPLSRATTCPDVDVPAPVQFDQYIKSGF